MSYKFKSTSYEFKSTSSEFKFTNYEFKSTSYEFTSTSSEFKSTSYEFKFTNSRIIKSMKTQVNSLKSSLFPKIISPKLFGSSAKPWTFPLNYYCQALYVSPRRINGGLSSNGFWSVHPLTLIFSTTKQPYSKLGNSRMHWYENAVLTSRFY